MISDEELQRIRDEQTALSNKRFDETIAEIEAENRMRFPAAYPKALTSEDMAKVLKADRLEAQREADARAETARDQAWLDSLSPIARLQELDRRGLRDATRGDVARAAKAKADREAHEAGWARKADADAQERERLHSAQTEAETERHEAELRRIDARGLLSPRGREDDPVRRLAELRRNEGGSAA